MAHHKARFFLTCALLLSIPIIQSANSLLAPYSETRSFRDALEGRSLEDAISGPVDKDMSSYGDRDLSIAPPMMMTVPANGNLNDVVQQRSGYEDNEQQKFANEDTNSGSEREPLGLMGVRQQMMEQNYGRQMQRPSMPQMMNGRYMKQMMANSQGRQRSTYESGNNTTSGYGDASFGEEPSDHATGSEWTQSPGVRGRYSAQQTLNQPRTMMMNAPQLNTQSMVMSLVNKAKYMSMQKNQMNQPMNTANYDQQQMRNSVNDDSMAYTISPIDSTTTTASNQLRKMSPAMMNAMLNKLMAIKQKHDKQQAPALMPAGMSSSMMSPQAYGSMSSAKREQYKQTMMAGLMQQKMRSITPGSANYGPNGQEQQQNNENSHSQQQQMSNNNNYNPTSATADRNGGSYAIQQRPNMMLDQGIAAKQQASGYNKMAQNNQISAKNRPFAARMMSQQGRYNGQQQKLDSGAKPVAEQSEMTAMNRYGASMTRPLSYGPSNESQKSQAMISVMKNLRMEMTGARNSYVQAQDAPMNGFRQAFNQQREQPSSQYKSDADGSQTGNDDSSSQDQSYSGSGDTSNKQTQMTSTTQTYGQEDAQQQQDTGSRDGDYNASPKGMAEPFAFDYKIKDNYGNGQYRKEESDEDGAVRGAYGYMDAGGIYRHVEYVADENGFRAKIKSNEPGLSSTETGNQGSSSLVADGQQSMKANMGNDYQIQQDQQQVMMPMQTELNENAEK